MARTVPGPPRAGGGGAGTAIRFADPAYELRRAWYGTIVRMTGPGDVRGRDWRHTRTDRLLLDAYDARDLPDLHAVHADPGVWRHYPRGRHRVLGQTAAMLTGDQERWRRDGLACWSVRLAEGGTRGPVVGRAGCSVRSDWPWWTLYYRLAPAVQGRGLAVEAARHSLAAAADVDPGRPVLAFLVEHNVGSRRTAERLGLRLVWRGPDVGNPDPDAVRLVYLDRDPTPEVAEAIERLRV